MQFDFSFDEIKFYVSHVMKWQKTVIVNALSKYSTFTLDPKSLIRAENNQLPEKYINEYSNLIKIFEEPKILDHAMNQGQNIVEMGLIIRLLQIDLVKECNRYIYLKNKDFKTEKFFQKNFDMSVYTALKKYSMKRCHIHEIAWKEDINLRDIFQVLKNCDSFGTYFI